MSDSVNIQIINNIHKQLSESIRHLMINNKKVPKINKKKKSNNKNKENIIYDKENLNQNSNRNKINISRNENKNLLKNKNNLLTEGILLSNQNNLLKDKDTKYFHRNYYSYNLRKNSSISPHKDKNNKSLYNTNYLFDNYNFNDIELNIHPNRNNLINTKKVNTYNNNKIIKRNDNNNIIKNKIKSKTTQKIENNMNSIKKDKSINNNDNLNISKKRIKNKNSKNNNLKINKKNNINNIINTSKINKLIISNTDRFNNKKNEKIDIIKFKEKWMNYSSRSMPKSININIKLYNKNNKFSELKPKKFIKNINNFSVKKYSITKNSQTKKLLSNNSNKKIYSKNIDKNEGKNQNEIKKSQKINNIKEEDNIQDKNITITDIKADTKRINSLYEIKIDSIMGIGDYEMKNDNQDSLFIMTNNSSINIYENKISNFNLFLEEQYSNNKKEFKNKNLKLDNTYTFLGICDGHGDQGKTISNYLANRIPTRMNHYLKSISNKISKDNFSEEIEPNIKSIFHSINSKLFSMQSIDISYSGSCFCSLLISPTSIISINLGNSRAIVGAQKNNSDKNEFISYCLTDEHTPLIKNEKERIIKNGGNVLYEKDEYDREYGPLKVWKKNSLLPGLLPTRTFGDKEASLIGIISEPEIKYFEMKENFKFIVIGSNGLWSFISNEECVQIISKYYLKNNIHEGIKKIIEIAKSRWIEQKEDIIEDISIIIGFLKEFNI